MTRILIIGAHGEIARVATRLLLDAADVELTLFLRKAGRLQALEGDPRVRIVEGDAADEAALEAAMQRQDVVYANLAGDMTAQARAIVAAMTRSGVKRLLFISSMGIYDEVPGETYGALLDPYRGSVRVIEASSLDYTIIRPAWLNDNDEIAYGVTLKGEPFREARALVSRKSVADLIVTLALAPGLYVRESLGVHKASGRPF